MVVACVADHGRRNLAAVNQKFSGLLTRSRAKEKEGKWTGPIQTPSPLLKAHLKVHKMSYSLHNLEKYFVHYCFPL